VLGSRAWDALFGEISGSESGPPVLFAPELVVRGSTAVARS
jgi:hypothetical protein